MVNLGGTPKVDFLGTCFGGDGLGHREKPIDSAQVRAPSRLFGYLLWWQRVGSPGETDLLWGEGFSITGLMQAMTSDGKSGRYPKSRLFWYLLWW